MVTKDVWEIRRLASCANVRGGFSRLLKQFERTHQPQTLYSDCDLRWSEGNVYVALGMQVAGESDANYSYVRGYSQRLHRLNFTKNKLVEKGEDFSKTEWEIMTSLGYDRIWDCGIRRYAKHY